MASLTPGSKLWKIWLEMHIAQIFLLRICIRTWSARRQPFCSELTQCVETISFERAWVFIQFDLFLRFPWFSPVFLIVSVTSPVLHIIHLLLCILYLFYISCFAFRHLLFCISYMVCLDLPTTLVYSYLSLNFLPCLHSNLKTSGSALSASLFLMWWFSDENLCFLHTLYSTIYYSKYFIELNIDKSTQYVALWTHKRHPIPRPFGRAMECLLWVFQQKLIVL